MLTLCTILCYCTMHFNLLYRIYVLSPLMSSLTALVGTGQSLSLRLTVPQLLSTPSPLHSRVQNDHSSTHSGTT